MDVEKVKEGRMMSTSTPSSDGDRLWTPEGLANYLNVPLSTVYRWRSTGKGPAGFRVGKYLRYRPEAVEAWEQEQIEKEQADD